MNLFGLRATASLASLLVVSSWLMLVSPPSGFSDDNPRLWRGWRGDHRDARVDKLPQSLPNEPFYRWTHEVEGDSLGGIACTQDRAVIIGRDQLDKKDIVTCLDLKNGTVIWRYDYLALPPSDAEVRDGRLDYGNSPRATPLIVDEFVVTQGAFGDLNCIRLDTGKLVWSLNYVLDFDAKIPTWGWSGSPLYHDGLIYAQPGAEEAALIAVRLKDGEVEWEAAGSQAAYTSPVVGTFGGRTQVITTDINFWGGYDAKTGTRLWRLKPQIDGEFHVPTALVVGSQLALIGEANGIRMHSFDASGKIVSQPTSTLKEFNPDTHTPAVVGSQIVGAHLGLWVMSSADLAKHQEITEDSLHAYCSILTDGDRFLVLNDSGGLLLYSLENDTPTELGRIRLKAKNAKIYAHPAWIDGGLVYREGNRVHFVELN